MIRKRLSELPVEEVANTLTHGFGLILSLVGFVVLVVLAAFREDVLLVFTCIVYGLSLVVLYTASTVYHSTTSSKLKRFLQTVDHCCIYLLIAGSYTPFGLTIGGPLGQNLLVLIWAFALAGIAAKLVFGNRFPVVSVLSYLVMGWIGVFAIEPLLQAIGTVAIALIVSGGLAYSFGVIFFAWKRIRHHHAIFHVFVLAGSILHYTAVVLYVIPFSMNV